MGDVKLLQVYRCEKCGNIVEVLHAGAPALVCCGEPMKLLEEQTADAATEKHVPVVESKRERMLVKVGSVAHPMNEDHYIEWIEVIAGDQAYREFLKPGEVPQAEFPAMKGPLTVREYCSIHGLWKAEV